MYVPEDDSGLLGFRSFARVDAETVELRDLWVEPAHIGEGYGKRLGEHAVSLARELGFARIVLIADPNAEQFYSRKGTAHRRTAVVNSRPLECCRSSSSAPRGKLPV